MTAPRAAKVCPREPTLEMTANDIVRACYLRWRNMPQQQVLAEMAILFHLAVKIDDVKRLAEKE